MRYFRRVIGSVVLQFVSTTAAQAVIGGRNELEIDFTHPQEAESKCVWAPADRLTATPAGLEWSGSPRGFCRASIQTRPIGVGLSWRPITAMSCRVEIQAAATAATLPGGQRIPSGPGTVYVRYSPDLRHWSTWQALQPGDADPRGQKREGRLFSGTIQIPMSERTEYSKYVSEYSTLDVPWTNDEEAVVKWALARDPELFERHIPFIGHVEFLYEADFLDGQPITSFRATMGWFVSGLHSPPKDENLFKDRMGAAWRFAAPESPQAAASAPAAESAMARVPAGSPSRQFRRDLVALENLLLDRDIFQSASALERLQREVAGLTPALAARVRSLKRAVLEEARRQEVSVGDGYLWVRRPIAPLAPKPQADAQQILDQQRRSKATAGVAVVRIRLEDPASEEKVGVRASDLNTWSCCWGYGGYQAVADGDFVLLGKAYQSGVQKGRIDIHALRHAAAGIDIEIPENQVIYAGELIVRALPREKLGHLLVRVTPEAGLSLSGARVHMGRGFARRDGGSALGPDGTCLIEDLGAGSCQLYVDKPGVLCGPRVEANVAAGETRTMELQVFARRRVEIEWAYRVPAGEGEWTAGTSTLLTGDSLPLNMWGANASILELSEWYGATAHIQGVNGRLKPAPADDFEHGRVSVPAEQIRRSGRSAYPIAVGRVFAVRYGPDAHARSEGEALVRIRSIEPAVPLATSPAP